MKNRLRELRMARNLRLIDLEEKTGIDFSTIAKYEKGTLRITQDNLCTLADFFRISIDYLLCRTKEENHVIVRSTTQREIIEKILTISPKNLELLKAMIHTLIKEENETYNNFNQELKSKIMG